MANSAKSDTSITMANQLIALCGQAKQLYDGITAFNARNASLSPDTFWRLMATATVNGDGSVGTADGSPNLAHPITVSGLNRAEVDLLSGLTFAAEYAQFCAGTLPTNRAAVARLAVLDTLVG